MPAPRLFSLAVSRSGLLRVTTTPLLSEAKEKRTTRSRKRFLLSASSRDSTGAEINAFFFTQNIDGGDFSSPFDCGIKRFITLAGTASDEAALRNLFALA